MTYQIRILAWSATDYAYLVNNDLGWVSDCDRYWQFACAEDMHKFRRYLNGARICSCGQS